MKDKNLTDWNENQKKLKSILLDENYFDEAIDLCLFQHAMVHSSGVDDLNEKTLEDDLWENLDEKSFRDFVNQDHGTVARNMWHATRLEDITMNMLVAGEPQILLSGNWLKKLNCKAKDTGNAMTDDEVIELSNQLNMAELRNYRMAVGRKTQQVIKGLIFADLKVKVDKSRLQNVLDERAVLDVEGANWLIDFWGRKNVAGILLMPVTRHNLVHINQSKRIKLKLQKRNTKK